LQDLIELGVVPVDLADVHLGTTVGRALEAERDIAPDRCAVLARGRLQRRDQVRQTRVGLLSRQCHSCASAISSSALVSSPALVRMNRTDWRRISGAGTDPSDSTVKTNRSASVATRTAGVSPIPVERQPLSQSRQREQSSTRASSTSTV